MPIKISVEVDGVEDLIGALRGLFGSRQVESKPQIVGALPSANGVHKATPAKPKPIPQQVDDLTPITLLKFLHDNGPRRIDGIMRQFGQEREVVESILNCDWFERDERKMWTLSSTGHIEFNKDR